MNIYIIPIFDSKVVKIKKFVTKSFKQAEDKFFKYLYNKYEFLSGDTLEELIEQLEESGIFVGQLQDIEDFT